MINKKLMKILQGSKKYLYWNLFFRILSLLMQIGIVSIFSQTLSSLLRNKLEEISLWKIVLFGISFIAIKLFSQYMASRIAFISTKAIKEKMRKIIFEKMMDDRINYRDKLSTSSLLQLSVEGVDQLEIYFTSYLPQLYYSFLAAFIIFIFIGCISIDAAICMILCLPLIPISIILVQKIAKKLLGSYWTSYTNLADIFLENLEGLTELKIYDADESRQNLMDDFAEKFRKATMKVLMMQLNSTSIMDIIAYGGTAAGIGIAILEFSKNSINVFGLTFIILLAAEFFLPLRLLGSFFHIAMNGIAASNKLMALIDSDSQEVGKEIIKEDKLGISFKNVSFSYDGQRKILDKLSLDIRPKQLTSLVGVSGSGKSTIARLIKDSKLAYDGEILINDIEKTSYLPGNIKENIINIDFNARLFKGSVRENLSIANPALSDEDMIGSLKKVNLYEFFESLSGLDTPILEEASNLSGGQRQRLALARALLFEAKLYIFDEATSNIDGENEREIMKVIRKLAKEKSVLIISHKLINLVDSDIIYFLEDGKIKASGDHESLYKSSKSYKNIFDKQEELCSYAMGVANEK